MNPSDRQPWLRPRHLAGAALVACMLVVAGCKRTPTPPTTASGKPIPADETAEQFIARVNQEMRDVYVELSAAQWISSTYINDDSELLAAKANERWLTRLNGWIQQARNHRWAPRHLKEFEDLTDPKR